MTTIPIDQIDIEPGARQIADAAADERLRASIAATGVLEPITVVKAGNRFTLRFGGRRLAAARACGHIEIPAAVLDRASGETFLDQLTVDSVRARLHLVDQWRAAVALQENGATLAQAAASLGIEEQQMRRLDKLGRLHPDVLREIEKHGVPQDRHLAMIAAASHKTQRAALKSSGKDSDGAPVWWKVTDACRISRFSRDAAIFDHALMAWDEDLFAEPGSDEQFTTADLETFTRHQAEAALKAAHKRSQLVEWDARSARPTIWPGYRLTNGSVKQPRKIETVFLAIDQHDGNVVSVVAENIEEAKAAAKKAKAAERGQDQLRGVDATEADDDDASDAPTETAPAWTSAAIKAIHQAKTEALTTALRTRLVASPLEQVIGMLVLTFAAENVSVRGGDRGPFDYRFRSLCARILLPGGGMDALSGAVARDLAAELMARVLRFGENSGSFPSFSGDAAEWIGAEIDAQEDLPRFDTAKFLEAVQGGALRQIAESIGMKSSGSVKALRERLVGHAPRWRPPQATFGAAAPTPFAEDDEAEGEGDNGPDDEAEQMGDAA